MKLEKNALMTLAALVLVSSPTLALAPTSPITDGHCHTSSSHDHTPRVHDRTPVAHH